MQASSNVATILFTDIESSTRLWEEHRDRMASALARHDALAREAVEGHHGEVVKMTGDGIHAVFGNPVNAIDATLALQRALSEPAATDGVPLQVRCGLHLGVVDRRDNDVFGGAVNRAARVMAAAHGGQVLLSQAVVEVVRDRLPKDVSLRDLGQVRLRDLRNAEHVYQLLHPELRPEFPALRSLASTPNNLPREVTSFVGRERELIEAQRLLEGTRLLTLTGIGGSGKTRFALKLAETALESYTDGVYFLDLAPLAEAERVPLAVATTLGLREAPDKPVVETLCEFLGDQKTLLIFDNCEHLLKACAKLAQRLLAAVPHLRIVATSREGLGIAGEQTLPIRSLSLVPADLEQDVAASKSGSEGARLFIAAMMSGSEAARLFVERAQLALPEFALSAATAPAVAEICRRLDGIPLAIELAAARVRLLSVEQIRARLNDRFRLLTGNDKDLPRHRTLQGVIEWSYEHLSPGEQQVQRRLAVFAGGATLAAVSAIAGDAGEELAMIETLGQLVDKSLVVVQRDASDEPRYSMLDTVREYSAAQLERANEAESVRTQHLDYFLEFAEEAKPHTYAADAAVWYRRLDAELSNLLAAHAWCDTAPHGADKGLRLVNSLRRHWTDRGLFRLGMRMTKEALARPGAQQEGALRANVLCGAGHLAYQQGLFVEARDFLEESLRLAKAHADHACVALALQLLGDVAREQGDDAATVRFMEASLAVALQFDDHRRAAMVQNNLAMIAASDGDLERASSLIDGALGISRARGLARLPGIVLTKAVIEILRQDHVAAASRIIEAANMAIETGSQFDGVMVLDCVAGLASAVGDAQRAARAFGTTEAVLKMTGRRRIGSDVAIMRRMMSPALAALGERAYSEALEQGGALVLPEALSEAREWLDEWVRSSPQSHR